MVGQPYALSHTTGETALFLLSTRAIFCCYGKTESVMEKQRWCQAVVQAVWSLQLSYDVFPSFS